MPAIAGWLPAKYLIKDEAPKTISSPQQHEAYISRLLELQRKAHRMTEETETAKLLIVLIADYERKHFTIEKVSGVEVLKELMDTNGLRQKDLAEDLGGESIVSLIRKEKPLRLQGHRDCCTSHVLFGHVPPNTLLFDLTAATFHTILV